MPSLKLAGQRSNKPPWQGEAEEANITTRGSGRPEPEQEKGCKVVDRDSVEYQETDVQREVGMNPTREKEQPATASLEIHGDLSHEKSASLGAKRFVTHILHPRGINMIDRGLSSLTGTSPFKHFGSVKPPPGCDVPKYYNSHNKELSSSTIWIAPTDRVVRAICNNYIEMKQSCPRALVETEWADDAVRMLLKREPRMIMLNLRTGRQRRWLPMRMREESFRPVTDNGLWEMPLIVHCDVPADAAFTFNVRPDCSYWIWTGGFGADMVEKLESVTSVRYRRALCPYLTVEVKREFKNKAATMGRHQLAASASVALFNRFRLRERGEKRGKSTRVELLAGLRHYGLLLAGVHYEFWCFQPHLSTPAWSGCTMRRISAGELDNEAGVRSYINWINEIHRWGNTEYSNGCAFDVYTCLD